MESLDDLREEYAEAEWDVQKCTRCEMHTAYVIEFVKGDAWRRYELLHDGLWHLVDASQGTLYVHWYDKENTCMYDGQVGLVVETELENKVEVQQYYDDDAGRYQGFELSYYEGGKRKCDVGGDTPFAEDLMDEVVETRREQATAFLTCVDKTLPNLVQGSFKGPKTPVKKGIQHLTHDQLFDPMLLRVILSYFKGSTKPTGA